MVHQVYPRSFADSDGDGIGDLRGVLEHVDHLVDLGVDVVWLSPVHRSPQDDNGHDISDHDDVDPVCGTLADPDALVEALGRLGVYAHCSGEPLDVDLDPLDVDGEVVLANHDDVERPPTRLRPWEVVVVRTPAPAAGHLGG